MLVEAMIGTFQKRMKARQMNGLSLIWSKTEDEKDGGTSYTFYPGFTENQLRWGFIRNVYGILSAQMLLTTIVSSSIVLHAPLNNLITANPGTIICSAIMAIGLLWPWLKYRHQRLVSFALLGLFTVCLSVPTGAFCARTDGKIVLQALGLTSTVVASLTAYTFWASKMGKDFSFLGPYLFSGFSVLLVTSIIQFFFPLGPTSSALYGAISAMLFSGYIVYDTESLIKRFNYDEYIPASVNLYLGILNLFLQVPGAMSRK